MVKFGKREIAKENFYAVKKPIKDWDVNVDNLFQVFDCILYQDIRWLVLIMPKMNAYIKIFKVEDKINKSIFSVWMMRNY